MSENSEKIPLPIPDENYEKQRGKLDEINRKELEKLSLEGKFFTGGWNYPENLDPKSFPDNSKGFRIIPTLPG